MVPDYEKLGMFYLGRVVPAPGAPASSMPVLYPSKHLTTHAVVVGMTGSGKTGLGITLLEEAALDGIPAVVIDPKGDLANLLLTFPELRGEDFAPWVDPEEAARKGLSPEAHAQATAAMWAKGLADWGQSGERIAQLRKAADLAVYTPGSQAGRPLALLASLDPPKVDDAEVLAEVVTGTVSALLGLLGMEVDPLQSREHILISRILHEAWDQGQGLDLASLIRGIQRPPFAQVGVLDLESFFPEKDRGALAMSLNNLLASPRAAGWMRGQPLDVDELLEAPDGRPRVSVLSIAHLGDAERMFFVSTLLGAMVAWMRRQSGSSALRAVLYMDEIAGYFPPTANPPSKAPMLTLLKQARAFGLGVVLATQNPVDLDYKGLSNCGTWFVGRLQTERDKLRLLDGLMNASGGGDRAKTEALLSSLGNRVFLLHDVHEDAPQLFQTRWTLSYLRGPIERDGLRRLCADVAPAPAGAAGPAGAPGPARSAAARPAPAPPSGAPAPRPAPVAGPADHGRPLVPAGLDEVFLVGAGFQWEPGLFVHLSLHHADPRLGVDAWRELDVWVPFGASALDLDQAVVGVQVGAGPPEGAGWGPLPGWLGRKSAVSGLQKQVSAWAAQTQGLRLLRCPAVKLVAGPDEPEARFRQRVSLALREARDTEVEALRRSMSTKLAALADKERRAWAKVEKEEAQAQAATVDTAMSFGATLLGAFFGKKTFSASNVSKATRAARSVGRASEQRGDVARAREELDAIAEDRRALEAELERQVAELGARFDRAALDEVVVAPKKADLRVERVAVGWRAG